MIDPYETLGVERTASADDIRKAYRRLVKTLHPDLNPGDKAAEARFKDVSNAYDLLSDQEKRKRFDAGEIDASGAERPPRQYYRDYAGGAEESPYANGQGFADFADFGAINDIFSDLLRRERGHAGRGGDIHFHLTIDFLDAINGGATRVTLPDGSVLDVTIPPGVEEGQTMRLRGKGAPARGKGEPGDALIELAINPHRFFVREGKDIRVELPVTLTEAVLGARVQAPTPTGDVMLTIPKGSNTGAVLRLKGKGVPKRGGAGDELVTLRVVLPPQPDPELETFLASWAGGKAYDPRKDMQS